MTRLRKSALIALLIVLAVGIYVFTGNIWPTKEVAGNGTQDSSLSAEVGERGLVDAPGQPKSSDADLPAGAVERPPIANDQPQRAYLNAESALLNEMGGNQGMNVRAVASLLKSDQFTQFMDQLALEGGGSSLARDITDLYSLSAQEANNASGNALDVRISCGVATCAIAANAPTAEAFDEWFKSFASNPDAPPHAAGRYDKSLENGLTEYRVIFSSDPTRSSVIMRR